jgi:hypothetical protein
MAQPVFTVAYLERLMQIADDIRKKFLYEKGSGKWYYCDRNESEKLEDCYGPFNTFWDALNDAVEPYIGEDSDEPENIPPRLRKKLKRKYTD